MERERREKQEDLELGKQHMIELLKRIMPLVKMDEEKNNEYAVLLQDLQRTQEALDIKKLFNDIKRRLTDMDIRPVTGAQRPEDREEIEKLHRQLVQIPGDILDE